MFKLPDLSSVKVRGPFWSATLRVLRASAVNGATGALLNAQNFSTLIKRAFVTHLVPPAQGDPDFSTTSIDGKSVVQATATDRVIVRQFPLQTLAPFSDHVLTGRMRFRDLNGGQMFVLFRTSIPGVNDPALPPDTFYRLGIDSTKRNPPNSQSPDLRFFFGADPETESRMGETKFLDVAGAPDTWFRFRIDVKEQGNGTRISVKVWNESQTEPVDFPLVFVNTNVPRPGPGSVAIFANGGGQKFFDDLRVSRDGSSTQFAIRTLFTDDRATLPDGGSAFLPNTVLALCEATRVAINDSPFVWTRPAGNTPLDQVVDLQNLVDTGRLSLMLLSVDSTALANGATEMSGVCLAGSINLGLMNDATSSSDGLRASLFGGDSALAASGFSVHSSGISIQGPIRLPWEDGQPLSVPLLLEKFLPGPGFRLVLDTERLEVEDRDEIVTRWRALSTFLNPASPQARIESTAPIPKWLTLEIANPLAAPRFFREWNTEPWRPGVPLPPLTFAQSEFSILIADQQPYDSLTPPTSFARIVPERVSIARVPAGGSQLQVKVNDGTSASPGVLRYRAAKAGSVFPESFTITGVEVAYDPVETARRVRRVLELPAPEGAPPNPPVLWSFMPLEDGWAQLPILNLTEEIYLNAGLANSSTFVPEPPNGKIAVLPEALDFRAVLGGRAPSSQVLKIRAADSLSWTLSVNRPWLSVTPASGSGNADVTVAVSPAGLESGRRSALITVAPVDVEISAVKVGVSFTQESALQGVVSFSNDHPDVLRANEAQQAWRLTVVSGASSRGVWTLNRGSGAARFELASVEFEMDSPDLVIDGLLWFSTGKPSAQDALPDLSDWASGLYSVPLKTVKAGVDLFPSPLTFALGATGISFSAATSARLHADLNQWTLTYRPDAAILTALEQNEIVPPDLLTQVPPLIWRRQGRLPMIQALPMTQSQEPPNYPNASRQLAPFVPVNSPAATWTFGVNGSGGASVFPKLIGALAPAPEWADKFDLPMTCLSLPGIFFDPKTRGDSGLTPQYRYDLPYADEIHALAQLPKAAPEPLPESPRDSAIALPEPLARETFAQHWRTLSTKASLAAGDGVTAFAAANGSTNVQHLIEGLLWRTSASLDLNEYPGSLKLDAQPVDPLGGITGRFSENNNELQRIPDGQVAADAFEITAGSMAAKKTGTRLRDQSSLFRSRSSLNVPKTILRTPVQLGTDARELVTLTKPETLKSQPLDWNFWFRDLPLKDGVFDRKTVRSAAADDTDVNDPEAQAAARNHLNGYEWRLGIGGADSVTLAGLRFFPLTLERVDIQGEQVSRVEMVGRLQLPLSVSDDQQTDFDNAVQVVFQRDNAGLALQSVALVRGVGEWPLALADGVASNQPRLLWSSVALTGNAIRLASPKLKFFLFEEEWTMELPNISFALSPVPLPPITVPLTASNANPGVFPSQLSVTLDLTTFTHSTSLLMKVQLGQAGALAFDAGVLFQLLKTDGTVGGAEWSTGTLFRGLRLKVADGGAMVQTTRSLQFSWTKHNEPGALQFLPAMTVNDTDTPGFAAITFDVATVTEGIPGLTLKTAVLEALLPCAWSQFLQQDRLLPHGVSGFATREMVSESSAGDLTLGYVGELAGEWKENFLLNGFLEVKNLISWPKEMTFDAQTRVLKLPRNAETSSHYRHTIRVLLNQHSIPGSVLTSSLAPLLFDMKAGATWQFLATVEHQIIEVTSHSLASGIPSDIGNDRRWVAPQEVRIVTPGALKNLLVAHRDSQQPDSSDSASPVDFGYFRPALRDLLIDELDHVPAGTLLVEASAPHWIKRQKTAVTAGVTLQILPGGSQQAVLSSPSDFEARGTTWLLLTTPFLGRIQTTALENNPAQSVFQKDPVGTLSSDPLSKTARSFASRAGLQELEIPVPAADGPVMHSWPRLDPMTLEENLFRLQVHVAESGDKDRLPSVLSALPDTPARFSRPTALQSLFNSTRNAFPPVEIDPVSGAFDETGALVWRKRSHMTVQGAAGAGGPDDTPYGWHLVGVQLLPFLLQDDAPVTEIRRYAAVTVLPAEPEPPRTPANTNPQRKASVSYAVSPYLSMSFLRRPDRLRLLLVSTELLCLDPATGALRPVATRLWDPVADLSNQIAAWAQQTRLLLAPESPVVVVRRRDVNGNAATTQDPTQAQAIASFSFTLAAGVQHETLTKRAFRLRAPLSQLRFREAAYGGGAAPIGLQPFELAAPQVVGAQPVRLEARPANTAEPAEWPFGWSGLRFSVRYGVNQTPAIGFDPKAPGTRMTLWWQAPHYIVQFRSADSGTSAVAGLPAQFRAPAIQSLRPVLPNPPLPALKSLASTLTEYQPVLPGSIQYSLVGDRPGLMLALRHHLVRQSAVPSLSGAQPLNVAEDPVTVSGSIPVHHRLPRPVLLPENTLADTALQPCRGILHLLDNSLVTAVPADETFFAGSSGRPASAVRLTLTTPAGGAVDSTWTGDVQFTIEPSTATNPITVQLSDGPSFVDYEQRDGKFVPKDSAKLSVLLANKRPGDVLTLVAKVARNSSATDNFSQSLSFPVRFMDPDVPRLPLAPFFVHFEDPEYNRQLASASARAAAIFQDGQNTRTVTLATDRKIYNPDSTIHLRFDRDDDQTVTGDLTISRVDASANVFPLITPRQITSGVLVSISLPNAGPESGSLVTGDTLQFELTAGGTVKLRADIVEVPVVPVPQAAYALLRKEEIASVPQVECVRFAWGTLANRVELVAPEDLRTEIVRRRAVFQWADTARRGMLVSRFSYRVQKIAANGSTHFPDFPTPA